MNSSEQSKPVETVLDAMRRVTEKEKSGDEMTGTEHLANIAMMIIGMCVAVNRVESSFDVLAVRKHAQDSIFGWIENEIVREEQVFMLEAFAASLHTPQEPVDWRDEFRAILGAAKTGQDLMLLRSAKTYIVLHPVSQLIKIGKSFDPDKRIHTLSTQSGAVLKVLLIIDSDVERELHSRFSAFRVHGEWFDDQQGLISEYVSEVQGGAA